MKLSCSAYQAGSCSYAQKILSGHGHVQNYGATSSTSNPTGESTHGLIMPSWKVEEIEGKGSPNDNSESINEVSSSYSGAHRVEEASRHTSISSHSDGPPGHSDSTGKTSSRSPSESPAHRLGLDNRSRSKSVGEQQWTNLRAVMAWYARLRRIKRTKSNQRWMKLRTTVQISGAITSTVQKKATLKREDSFLKRFSTRQVPEAQETFEIGDDDGSGGGSQSKYRRKKKRSLPRSVVNPDGNFYFYWLFLLTVCVLYNLWTLIVRESFPELQSEFRIFWILADAFTDLVIFLDLAVQFRTCYLEQGLMVYKTKKLAKHYAGSKHFWFDVASLTPTDFLQFYFGTHPMFRIPRFLKTYRMYSYYYMVESRTVYPNVWRVVNLIHILLLLAHWFGCFYYLISEAEGFDGPWVYPHPGENPKYAPLLRKYLGSLYWSTLTLTTIGDLPTPYSNWQLGDRRIPFDPNSYGGYRNHSHKSRLLHIHSNNGYLFTIVSYLIGVFIFATIVGQVGNVITNRNANRLEFERLLDGAKMYMRHHRVPRDMQRRVLRWYDYSWSRGRIQGGGDINTALGLLPDKLKTELALHVNLSVLRKVTIFQECQPEFLHDLVLKMKAYIFTPGDLICRKGEVAREMFIIADGILEVISETGRVLTTMQAGDFFGEIGILNLDGLNKRTADVRSVGYSELFSLSREDVLAAMKDYPEAQDILQTLGRKRLMEARKANAPVKKVEKKSPLTLLGHGIAKGPDDVGANGDTTGKRIVEKLRSDVKGLRNAIRKSRKSNSSKEDSSEPESTKEKYDSVSRRKESTISVQQYIGGSSIVGTMIPASTTSRGVLKRMHNVVLSDEHERVGIGGDTSMSNVSPTILPKRVQVQLPPSDGHPRSSSTSGERQVIGAGLPLMQRLRLLKQKEDKEKQENIVKVEEEKPILLRKSSSSVEKDSNPPKSPLKEKSFFQTKVSIEPLPKSDKKLRRGSSESSQTSVKSLVTPSPLGGHATAQSHTRPIIKDSKETSNESNTSEIEIEKERQGSLLESEASTTKKDSRPSALRFQKRDPKNYGSVDDLSPEFSRLPFIKKLKILNERQKIAELLTNKTSTIGMLTRSTSEGSSEIPHPVPMDSENMHSVIMGRRTQSSSEPYGGQPRRDQSPFPLPLPSTSSSSSSSLEGVVAKKKSLPTSSDKPIKIPAEPTTITVCLSEGGDGSSGFDAKIVPISPQASPPYSPECNETPERRHLKSILKTLAKSGDDKEKVGADPQPIEQEQPELYLEDSQLLKEQTIAGYAARHRKFAKNVTFQRQAVTVVSPDEAGLLAQVQGEPGLEEKRDGEPWIEKPPNAHGEIRPSSPLVPENLRITLPLELLLGMKKRAETEESVEFQGHNLGLSVSQEECISGVFIGIKNIIQSRMEEFQVRFQDRFTSLEKEVRKRDETICLLQLRIQELEDKGFSDPSLHLRALVNRRNPITEAVPRNRNSQVPLGNGTHINLHENHLSHEGDGYEEDEEDEDEEVDGLERSTGRRIILPQTSFFNRGDSIDTVIDNTETFDDDDEVFRLDEDPQSASLNLQTKEVNSQWVVAERESIEMTELSGPEVPLWQLEFHRESTRRGEALTQTQPPGSVTVDIGNTSTEYESTSSSEEEKRSLGSRPTTSRQLQETPIKLGDSDKSSDEEEDGHVILESSDSDEFDNQNWEVQMLAKELNKLEESERRQSETSELDNLAVEEMLELDSEIQEMRDVVNSETLSPTELDMLESMLEIRTERVQAICKAYSVDESGSSSLPASSSAQALSKQGRIIGDVRPRGSVQYSHLPYGFANAQQRKRQWSPNVSEKRPEEFPYGPRKRPHVRRQSSLRETGFPSKLSTTSYATKRRESAGSLGLGKPSVGSANVSGGGKSFFSKFNFMRSLSKTFLYHPDTSSQEPKRESEIHDKKPGEIGPDLLNPSSPIQIPSSSSQQPSFLSSSKKCSSPAGILPLISSTLSSALSSSVKIDPGPSQSPSSSKTEPHSQPIFTIPAVPLTQPAMEHPLSSPPKDSQLSYGGENQPLLKK